MWNKPTKEQLETLPRLYKTERIPIKEKLVPLHFFIGNWDWYPVEYDPKDRVFFGLVKGFETEWGYFSLDELESVSVKGVEVDRDLYWKPKKIKDIEVE